MVFEDATKGQSCGCGTAKLPPLLQAVNKVMEITDVDFGLAELLWTGEEKLSKEVKKYKVKRPKTACQRLHQNE